MNSTRFRIAAWVMAHRGWAALFFALVTLGFAAGIPGVTIKTIFSDLLPKDDPFVQVFKDHPNFGNPLTVTVMIKRTDGQDIYNPETLGKVWQFTRDIDLTPGINHDSLISIATEKARCRTCARSGSARHVGGSRRSPRRCPVRCLPAARR